MNLKDVNHYSYQKLQNHIKQLKKDYPFITINKLGKSILKKDIFELNIGEGNYHTHFNASFHGNEWITTAALMSCIDKYLTEVANGNQTFIDHFKKHTISIVPMVNPDGVDLVLHGPKAAEKYQEKVMNINELSADFSLWKANINGVDLNKQFPALWDVEQKRKPKKAHFRDFPGISPLTEPESKIMANLMKNNQFQRIHALHTQGEEIYWGFQEKEAAESAYIAERYASVTKYKAVQYVDNYAGYKDWCIQEFGIPAFTIELGKGTNPLPFTQFNQIFLETWKLFKMNFSLTK